jgi:hypothetical protein
MRREDGRMGYVGEEQRRVEMIRRAGEQGAKVYIGQTGFFNSFISNQNYSDSIS